MAGRRQGARLAALGAFAAVAGGLALVTAGSGPGSRAAAQLLGFRAERVASFERPTYADNAPGFPNLLFVVERRGIVRVVRRGSPLDRPFLDLHRRVASEGYEQGMLSIAFPPDYERSRRFYVYYTQRSGDIAVDRFKRRKRRATRANPRSRQPVISIRHRAHDEHNGGTATFGPDGRLYLGPGDGGNHLKAQDRGTLLGKLLRIIPREHRAGYRVPAGNPFVGRAGRDEIFALGLRNPFRFSFDGETGRIAIGDVGQGAWEEVDLEGRATARGANYGWDAFEGRHVFRGPDPLPGHHPPMLEYPNPGAAAVTGGIVVHDPQLPSLAGRYLYADFFAGELRSFVPDVVNNQADFDGEIGVRVPKPVAFVTGPRRQVYVVSLQGGVYMLEPRGLPAQ